QSETSASPSTWGYAEGGKGGRGAAVRGVWKGRAWLGRDAGRAGRGRRGGMDGEGEAGGGGRVRGGCGCVGGVRVLEKEAMVMGCEGVGVVLIGGRVATLVCDGQTMAK